MGFFNRLTTGWVLGKQSLRLIWNDKTLLLFPVLSGSASLLYVAGIYFGIGPQKIAEIMRTVGEYGKSGDVPTVAVALALGLYFGLSFITVFFNVALVGCARISMEERDSKLVDGLRVAFAHMGSILLWALISGTVGLLLGGLEKGKRSGGIVRAILGVAWSVMTYFVLPVMVVEKVNVFSSMGRSAKIIKQSWGEGLGARFSIGWIVFLCMVPVILFFALLPKGGEVAQFIPVLVAAYSAVVIVFTQAAKQVLTVVLYRYATTKTIPTGFDQRDIQSAFL